MKVRFPIICNVSLLLFMSIFTFVYAQPEITIQPGELDFGWVAVENSDVKSLTIRNDGDEALGIDELILDNESFSIDYIDDGIEYNYNLEEGDIRMAIIIMNAEINGQQFVVGDYIGVFNVNGQMAGETRIEDEDDPFPVGIAVWGQYFEDLQDEDTRLVFRILDEDAGVEFPAIAIYRNGEGFYENDGFAVIDLVAYEVAVLHPGEELEVDISFSPEEFGEQEGSLTITSNDPEAEEVEVGLLGICGRALLLELRDGWNLISINVDPLQFYRDGEDRGPDLELMFAPLVEEELIVIMKNLKGEFWTTEWDYNSIPFWNLEEGYQLRTAEEVDYELVGEPIPFDRDITLHPGWNMIAYFPDYVMVATRHNGFYPVAGILENLIIFKDGLGRFLSWNYGWGLIFRPGQGYQAKISGEEDIILNYPGPQEEEGGLAQFKSGSTFPVYTLSDSEQPHNMSLLLRFPDAVHSNSGARVEAISDDGQVLGTSTIDYDGRCGLAVWGNDGTMGIQSGASFSLRYLDLNSDVERPLDQFTVKAGPGLKYTPDGFTVIDVAMPAELPIDYFLSQNYPNPFNSSTRISYGLARSGIVQVTIFDIYGRSVETLISEHQTAGNYSVVWDAGVIPSGVYFVKMSAGVFVRTQKVVLAK